jgi:hypothetical protein
MLNFISLLDEEDNALLTEESENIYLEQILEPQYTVYFITSINRTKELNTNLNTEHDLSLNINTNTEFL